MTWTTRIGESSLDPAAANLMLHGRAETALSELAALDLLGDGVELVCLDPPYRHRGANLRSFDDRADHGAWTGMMRTALTDVARALGPAGTVWLHVGDRDAHAARTLLDDVFGPGNFVADVAWERKKKASGAASQLAHVTDHILVAARDRTRLGEWTTGEVLPARRVPLHQTGNTPTTLTFPPGSVSIHPRTDTDTIPAGDQSTATVHTELLADVRVVEGRNIDPLVMRGSWRWTQERLDAELAAGVQVICPRLPLRPQAITGSGSRPWTTLWSWADGMATNEDATEHGRVLFDGATFAGQKPEELLERIIITATNPGDLVVDLFAGTGTTAAVAHKLRRRWIAVEKDRSVIERFTLSRLAKVVAGDDPGGITVRRTYASGYKLPAGWTPRDARRAGQWLHDRIADGIADDLLTPEQRAELARRLRDETTHVDEQTMWRGGGGFLVGELGDLNGPDPTGLTTLANDAITKAGQPANSTWS